MTDTANTPRTAAGRADHAIAWAWADGQSETAPLGDHSRNREGCEACQKIITIEAQAYEKGYRDSFTDGKAEAAAATPADCGCKPYSPCDRHQAESDARLAEPLDVQTLAKALPDDIWDYDGYSGSAKQLAKEIIDRLAAARPETEQ